MRPQPHIDRTLTVDAASTGTAIVEFGPSADRARVAQKTFARLEQQLSPDAAELAVISHAVFILRDGATIVKATMYNWRSDGTLEIAVPYSDRWDVAAVYIGQVPNAAGTGVVEPLFIAGSQFRADVTAAPSFDLRAPGRFDVKTDEECFPTYGDACGVGSDGQNLYPHVCYSCWGWFCRAPRNQCM